MKRTRSSKNMSGFALPTVLIASVVMLMVLLSGLVATTSTSTILREQYYQELMKEASEAGTVMAKACLENGDNTATWTSAKPLTPNTDCSGNPITGASGYLVDAGVVRNSFSVPPPVLTGNIQNISVTAKVDLMRASAPTGTPVRTASQTNSFNSFRPLSFRNVGFGYNSAGTHFGVVLYTGEAKMVGYNLDGRLGDGTYTSRSSPVNFILPANVSASRIYSNFLSIGLRSFVVAADGDVYATGDNRYGMLGVGSAAATINVPAKVALPPGVDGKFVGVGLYASYTIATNYNIYSAGRCLSGALGSNYTITGCTDRSSANVRVALPTVNLGDPNTLPVTDTDWVQPTNMAVDRQHVILRMQGGAVYTWGLNDDGQLGNGDEVDRSLPRKIGTWGDAGQTKAIQVANDGQTDYILDDAGDVYVAGWGADGQLAGAGAGLQNGTSGLCLRQPGTLGNQATLNACGDTATWQRVWWMPDKTIRIGGAMSTTNCLQSPGTYGATSLVTVETCSAGSTAQQWNLQDDHTVQNVNGGCLAMTNTTTATSGDGIVQRVCSASSVTQQWNIDNADSFRQIPIPASAGKVTRITTDNQSTLFLTDSGQVWGAGVNNRGVLGTGELKDINPRLRQYGTFNNVVNFYMTTNVPVGAPGTASDNNDAYVILDDGSVYGTGSNTFGQLGLGEDASGNDIVSNSEPTPVQMLLPNGVGVKSIQSGGGTTIFISQRGELYSVGKNTSGQLGDGTTVNSSVAAPRKYLNPFRPVLY